MKTNLELKIMVDYEVYTASIMLNISWKLIYFQFLSFFKSYIMRFELTDMVRFISLHPGFLLPLPDVQYSKQNCLNVSNYCTIFAYILNNQMLNIPAPLTGGKIKAGSPKINWSRPIFGHMQMLIFGYQNTIYQFGSLESV